ncbi:hypothetical protein SUGI_0254510 [Cryptomeria japonica]|uniref:F-box/LRR-repeat MAX2 homolog A n=1 Tax=Cryptomeria japonica TaxID=3369 RepID=UPI002408E2D9|nr:F-box/LRR-repeat MAX2 homolog A [Cryptomeria japonica]GLJ15499.1 hypothetical protein SUGI_0254510 [Cryptomeria japonica]
MRSRTQFSDIPEVIISIIFGLVKEIRTRNRMALVCKKWRELERATRLELCVRGNISNLYYVPSCFQGVTTLDLSQVSPWGYPVLDASSSHTQMIGYILKQAFPSVQNITIYARNARNIDMLPRLWPDIRHVKLVRWHQPANDPEAPYGELLPLLVECKQLQTLDLSQFYCWTEVVASALLYASSFSANLSSLNLLTLSTDGFKAAELTAISEACRNLQELYAVCLFDSRYILECVGDEALVTVAKNCTRIRVLHLVDKAAFGDLRGDPEEEFSSEDAKISRQGLEEMFRSLPSLEDLVLDVSQNVWDSGPALEFLGLQCKKIRALKLGHFHGVCKGPRPDGIAMCSNLERLCIKNCADLCDVGLEAIATGCFRLGKLKLQGCKQITEYGVKFCSSKLRKTLVDVSVSCCKHLDTAATLRALEPIRDRVRKLHIDCIWDKSIIEQASNDKSLERLEFVGVGSSCSSSNQLLYSRENQSPKCTSWEPSLELGLPDLNHADLDADSVILDTTMENDSLDLNASLYCEHSGSHSCIYLEHGKHISMGQKENVSRYVVSNVADSRAMDVDMKASEVEHDVSSDPDFVSSMGFMDFLGVNKKHQDLQMLEDVSDERLELTEGGCQMWSTTGVSSIRTSLENMEFEWPNKRKCINGLTVTEHCAGMYEQKRLCHRRDQRRCSTWTSLKSLSLWMPVGEMLTPLAEMGLEQCPMLEEIKIQVEGDCRLCPKPREQACGLSSLACYPSLSKLELDCGEVIGFALSAPAGQMDLSLWERWYLNGLRGLHLSQLNYWPPQDKDMNRRGLSLPAAGLLSECVTLRKLFVHGTAHEHFMMMFLRIPNLRDVQLREDYYPAHDNDTCTEMRTESCKRFEENLASRQFSD